MTDETEEEKRIRENAAANGQESNNPLSFLMKLLELLFSDKTPNYVELDAPRPDADKASVRSLQPNDLVSLSSQNEYTPDSPENMLVNNLLTAARQEVGVKELSGNNDGADVERFMETVGLEGQGLPWCAGFISYICEETMPGVINPTAGSLAMMAQMKSMGAFNEAGNNYTPQAGDVVFFDRGTSTDGKAHVAIVNEVKADGTIVTIEGNRGDAVRMVTYSPDELAEKRLLGFGDTKAAISNKLSFNTQISIAEAGPTDSQSPINTASLELEGSASMKMS